jgi:2-polyprenyl-3-methyl-5-hydroxy-6-metoxy-1,4-benzoquinol methylase
MTLPILNSQDFYDRQAIIHELMNDWPSRLSFELPFIRRALDQAGARTVLDVACGSGHHAIALAQAGYAAAGADLSVEMIAQARRLAEQANVSIRFEAVGFADLGTCFGHAAFDAVLCLGNSLPHVLTEADQLASLQAMHDRLKSGGVLILQNLNYDLRWKNRPRFLMLNSAIVEEHTILIWRMADYHDPGTRVPGLTEPCPEPGLITFHIATIEQAASAADKWQVSVTSTLQRPLFAKDLQHWLKHVGFKEINLFGGMDGSAFDPDSSPDLVIVGHA